MMKDLQRVGGVVALVEAGIYISAFIFFGAFWNFPIDADPIQKFAFLKENQTILYSVYLAMYVLFGIFLTVLVMALKERLEKGSLVLSQIAAVYGIVWVGMVIASGMIANVGLGTVIDLSIKDPEKAMTVWISINAVVEGLGGGNEVVGGIWVLLLSIASIKAQELSKFLNYFGLIVGMSGILTIYPADLLTEIFGLSQIVWFIWLGVVMLRNSPRPSFYQEHISQD